MKRVLGQALTVIATAVLAATLTPACAEDDRSLFVHGILAPSESRTNGACTYTADPGQALLYQGVLDAAVGRPYVAVALVGSQLRSRAEANSLSAESNRTHLNGAVVRVTDVDGATLGEFTSLATGFVDPGSGTSASYGTLAVTAIDAPTLAKIGLPPPGQDKIVLANVKVFGTTLGGIEVESGELTFPINVCNGCLIAFSPDPAAPDVRCAINPAGTATTTKDETATPCHVGQDEPVPCQLCQDREACR